MIKKNDFCTLEIMGMTAEGNGVGRTEDGMAVFVPLTAVGDVISCKIVKVAKSYCYGIIDKLITPSPDRTESNCPVSAKCGGCTFRHISYEAELAVKDKLVRDAFERLGSFKDIPFEEICGGETEFYRNKAQYSVAEQDGKAVCGFYSKRSHRVVPYCGCTLQPEIFGKLAEFCLDYVNGKKIPAYNEETGSGVLRHIYIRRGYHSGEIMLCFVVKNDKYKAQFADLGALAAEKFDGIKSVVMNINPKNTNVIMGDRNITLWGSDEICDILCGKKITLSPMSFYQVNTAQAEKLYRCGMDYAELTGGETVLDLYCGAGTIGLSFSDKAGKIIGCEIIPEAVENAKYNAEVNGVTNAEFYCGDAGKLAEKLANENIKPDVVVIDPPRKGCDELTLDSIVRMAPKRIVMISCNPATAARDAKYLAEKGYALKKVRAFDLFPRTSHVECVVLLSREKADDCEDEPKMISKERSKYKSWSNLKKQMHDLLCDSLKDKISYFYTSYHEVHNAYGRATINYNKKEMVAFSWVEMYAQEREVSQLYAEGKKISYGELEKGKWMPECKLCDANFINSLTIYLKTDIATSLHSDNYLLRVFAYMDRRVGKRTLVKIKDDVEKLPEWVKQFYQIRCEADGIVFPPKRITDECVCKFER